MKKLLTTALAILVAIYGYSQTYLPLTGGSLSGSLYMGNNANYPIYFDGGYSAYIKGGGVGHGTSLDLWTGVGATTPTLRALNGNIQLFGPLTGTSATFSNAKIGVWSQDINYARFGHSSQDGSNYGFLQRNDGTVYIKGPSTYITGTLNTGVTNLTGLLTGTSATFSGNVGIGTTSPAYGLDYRKNVPSDWAASIWNTDVGSGLLVRTSAVNTSMAFGVFNGTSYVLSARSDGNVGIGTNSASEKLVVKEAIGSDAIALYDGPGNKRLAIGQEASYTGNYIDSRNIDFKIKFGFAGGSGGNIIFMTQSNGITNHSEQMRIDKNGSVAIGTTNPQGYKLAVAGNVIAESVKVALQGTWPDYVFKPGNKLLSLPEVEKFVQQNNHLPEMPSEAEVKKEGIDLGQMDAKLLKKIEELTLYMIEQNKIIQQQNERILNLEKQINK